MNYQHGHFAASFLMVCTAAAFLHANPIVQPGEGVQVSMDWHTIAEPAYGAAMRYTVSNATITVGTDSTVPTSLNLRLTGAEVNAFELTSSPIDVPAAGMSLAYMRGVELHPSDAERGTMLPNDSLDRRKYDTFGITRASLMLHVLVVDMATGKSLGEVDRYHFNVTRRQELNDVVDNTRVNIDLTPFAGKQVLIKTIAYPSYNGRGCVIGSIPTLSSLRNATPGSHIENHK